VVPQGVGRTDLMSTHSGLPRGASWSAPDPLPGCSRHSPEVVQGLIEGRGLIYYPTHFPTALSLLVSKARR
jgi:hypothetical protein